LRFEIGWKVPFDATDAAGNYRVETTPDEATHEWDDLCEVDETFGASLGD
jgi:hypothetical protein